MAERGDRRPIAARELGITQKLAGWLVARGASADAISLAGMVAGLLAGLALALVSEWHDGRWLLWLLAALLIQLRTDGQAAPHGAGDGGKGPRPGRITVRIGPALPSEDRAALTEACRAAVLRLSGAP